jgi:CspA family cold shock protein
VAKIFDGNRSRVPGYPSRSKRFAIHEGLHTEIAFSQIPIERAASECSKRSWATGGVAVVEEDVMALGTVKWFNDAKGYGFISRADDGKDVFVHYSSITGEGFRTLTQGQTVEYDEQTGPKGLFAAKVLKVLESPAPAS